MGGYDFYMEASEILAESDNSVTVEDVKFVLEDTTSPITNRYIENLYKQVITKGHINFGDIPNSKGDIRKYSGYAMMVETLNTAKSISMTDGVKDVNNAVDTVIAAINSIESLSDLYTAGFRTNNEYVMMEYNSFVFACVEATSCILSEYVEFVKNFTTGLYQIKIRNTKYRAGAFFIDQLEKFNRITSSGNYRGYLQSILDKEKDNFVGATTVGIATVAISVLLAVVPVTRALVYQVFRMRTKLSDALALQAYFLEINKSCVEANTAFDAAKKEKILKKQENIRVLFTRLSDKLKVDVAKATRDSSLDRKKDNASLTLGDTRRQIDSAPYDILL